jgi:hypothetical protein
MAEKEVRMTIEEAAALGRDLQDRASARFTLNVRNDDGTARLSFLSFEDAAGFVAVAEAHGYRVRYSAGSGFCILRAAVV